MKGGAGGVKDRREGRFNCGSSTPSCSDLYPGYVEVRKVINSVKVFPAHSVLGFEKELVEDSLIYLWRL